MGAPQAWHLVLVLPLHCFVTDYMLLTPFFAPISLFAKLAHDPCLPPPKDNFNSLFVKSSYSFKEHCKVRGDAERAGARDMCKCHVLYSKVKALHSFLGMMQHTVNPDTRLEVGNCNKVQTQL